ncbi:MAG: hypothetical protein OXG65_02500 [Chloroflexi bacterium]|nr:hypothetical protein [Chloroflexota bacterium]
MRQVWALRLLVAVGLVLGVLSACEGAAEPPAPATPAPASTNILTNQDWQVVHAEPAAAVGQRVVLRARVYGVSQVDDDLVLCGWVDFDNDQLSTVFRIPNTLEGVERDAFVWVEGTVVRVADSDDGCADAPQPEVEVSGLTITDRLGVRPALRVVQVGQALERRGVRAVLERIEFAAEETRMYFTLENRRDETLLAFGTGLEIEIGGTAVPAVIPTGEGIPAPRGRVVPGATEHGGFQFPTLEPGGPPITVRWQGVRMEPSGEEIGEWTWVVDPTGAVAPEG